MILYLGGLSVGMAGMAIWLFFWRLSENEKFPESVRMFMRVLAFVGFLVFGLSFINIIGIWLDLCIADVYGLAVGIVGLTLTFVVEFVAGAVIGFLPFWITNRIGFWFRRYRRRLAVL